MVKPPTQSQHPRLQRDRSPTNPSASGAEKRPRLRESALERAQMAGSSQFPKGLRKDFRGSRRTDWRPSGGDRPRTGNPFHQLPRFLPIPQAESHIALRNDSDDSPGIIQYMDSADLLPLHDIQGNLIMIVVRAADHRLGHDFTDFCAGRVAFFRDNSERQVTV